ncbi:MAG: sugar ABC transporter ATP-binding protein [Opitutaceae bacterium]|jgi:ABC-type sugar transport system ATPase subunit|nr:sugar ABC transporter ATP-binding protein [Opitutaceae bacterium]
MPPPSSITCRALTKRFDRTLALDAVDFSVNAGEVHALCGENGAGKSTLARILAGVVTPDSGTISVGGVPAEITTPARARELGIGIVFQELDLFNGLSVAENMALGHPDAERFFVRRRALAAWCRPFLARVGLPELDPASPLGSHGIATAQLVAIARALALNARFLLLDEPTSSLTEEAADRLLALVSELKNTGTGIVYVSHKMREIFRVADRVTVLRDGSLVSTKPARDTSIGETVSLMVGRAIDTSARMTTAPRDAIALRLDNLSTRRVRGVSLSVRRGEIVGVAGLVGSGRSALGKALFGMEPWTDGSATLAGEPYRPRSPADAILSGCAYLPEDRRGQGLFLQTSVRHNASAAILCRLRRGPFVRRWQETKLVRDELARTRAKVPSLAAPVSALSGGNQQKVLLAKWLLTRPALLYLDDPTRGVDIGAKADVYKIIAELSAAGTAILLASSEMPELLRLSHRILVLHEGRPAGLLDAATATQEQIMALATDTARQPAGNSATRQPAASSQS